jgi:hypothetical protein
MLPARPSAYSSLRLGLNRDLRIHSCLPRRAACDHNGNITGLRDGRQGRLPHQRTGNGGGVPYNYLYTYFECDDPNRLSMHH